MWARVAALLPAAWHHDKTIGVMAFETFLAVATGFCVGAVINPLLPWLLYLPYAVAMRSMGLLRAETGAGALGKLASYYLNRHDNKVPVRVICISGRHLFRESLDGETPPPLQALALVGRLDVVMPSTRVDNPTIAARYSTYNEGFREASYPELDNLLTEMELGKKYLLRHKNTIAEHEMLCMWRVVILSGHCFVQTYFPNTEGTGSDNAPVFVFENSQDCEFSYYKTFTEMFRLISQSAKQRNPLIAPNAPAGPRDQNAPQNNELTPPSR